MDQISRKTDEVADRPSRFSLRLNLQTFAGEDEGYPSLEESQEFGDDAREFNAKMDKFMSDRTPKEETPAAIETENEPVKAEEAEKPEVVDPEKPKQDSETNRAFQEMRKAREEAERIAKDNADRVKRADEFVAQTWGHLGITTFEQYQQALVEDQKREKLREKGIEYDDIKSVIQEELESHPDVVKARQEQFNAHWNNQYAELSKAHPDAKVETWEDVQKLPNFEVIHEKLQRGYSLTDAYETVNRDIIRQRERDAAKQEALNSLNSKNHLKPNGTETADVEHVEIDEETMRMYRSLNKGKSDAEIRKWHKKHALGG